MKRILTKILLRILRVPSIETPVDKEKEQELFWGIYPTKEWRNYISRRDLQLLQLLGEGVSRDDYLVYLGHRMELQQLLRHSKQSFEALENKRKK